MACTFHFNDRPFRIGSPRKFGGNWSLSELVTERPSELPITSIPLLRSLPHRPSRSTHHDLRAPLSGLHVQYPGRFLGHGPVPLICVVCLRTPEDCSTVLGCGHLACTSHLSFDPFLTGSPGYFPGHWSQESPPTSPLPLPFSFLHRPTLPRRQDQTGQDDTGEPFLFALITSRMLSIF